MSLTALTLEYDGTQKSLAYWGYGYPQMSLLSQGVSTFTVTKVGGDPAAAETIPNWGLIKIRMGGTGTDGTSWTGGTIIFQGRRIKNPRIADPMQRGRVLVFGDAWYDLTQIIFQHYWARWNSGGTSATNFYFSRIFLFQDISAGPTEPWTPLPTDDQIQQILEYAIDCGANLQVGTIDPAWNLPTYPVKNITCAEALLMCLKLTDDVAVVIDHSTTPPTLNIIQRAGMDDVTLPFAGVDGSNRIHKSSRIEPRDDLVPASVVLQYQQINTNNDTKYSDWITDAYPVDSDGREMGAIVAALDLRGGVRQTIEADLVSRAFDPTDLDFWKEKKPDLADTGVTDLALLDSTINGGTGHLDGITVKDNEGTDISTGTYGYELLSNNYATWMTKSGGSPVLHKEVTVTGWFTYKRKERIDPDTPATLYEIENIAKQQISVHARLVNTASGHFTALKHFDPAETAPIGLAAQIYGASSVLQYQGTHTILEKIISEIITPATLLNLSGGASEWETMDAVIVQVDVDFFQGTQTVSFGPHLHLEPGQLVDRILMWRWRNVYDNPNLRSGGIES